MQSTLAQQSFASKKEKPLTVREAFQYKAEVAGLDFRDLLLELLCAVNIPGGEEHPEWQCHKLRLKDFLKRLNEGGMLDESDVESIFVDLTA